MSCLLAILHPIRTWRMCCRIMLGLPPIRPGSRLDRKFDKAEAKRAARGEKKAEREFQAAVKPKPAATGTGYVWEMEFEDWEDSGQ